jgi:hypothetical protein
MDNMHSGPSLLRGHPYTQAEKTDITETWRRFGWRPLSEQKNPGQEAGQVTTQEITVMRSM